jgi:hypothetical protein
MEHRNRLFASSEGGKATVEGMTAGRPKQRTRTPSPRAAEPSDGRVRRGGGLRRLPDLLNRVLDPAARRRGLAEAKLLTEWPTIVGPWLAARCQPVRLSRGAGGAGGVLAAHVAGAAALELQHSEPQVVERINDFFGYRAVSRLRLVQAPRSTGSGRASPIERPRLSQAEEAEIASAVNAIGNPALQAALAGLGRTLKIRKVETIETATSKAVAGLVE